MKKKNVSLKLLNCIPVKITTINNKILAFIFSNDNCYCKHIWLLEHPCDNYVFSVHIFNFSNKYLKLWSRNTNKGKKCVFASTDIFWILQKCICRIFMPVGKPIIHITYFLACGKAIRLRLKIHPSKILKCCRTQKSAFKSCVIMTYMQYFSDLTLMNQRNNKRWGHNCISAFG